MCVFEFGYTLKNHISKNLQILSKTRFYLSKVDGVHDL